MKRIMDLGVGEALDEIEMAPVTRLDLIKYAGASGDFNPIHTIDAEAEGAGLPGIIAHGMWTMGNLAKLFTPHLTEGFLQDYAIRFKGMVFIGDVITLKAVVADRQEGQVKFTVQAVNQQGKDVLKGDAVFSL
ncbi:MaoC/PaaZ C-terminal domain-containing protein [Planococcus sp. FY231025]|uniref:MaoC/PaaZ C-terminal domain-containing protein n=1 Tax=Planococcus sp. FY231025 TaxID=3455699 RepID=UPI003F933D41